MAARDHFHILLVIVPLGLMPECPTFAVLLLAAQQHKPVLTEHKVK
jgi:hypothetical protein